MRYNNEENKRIVRIMTWLIASIVVISAVSTSARWRDEVNAGQNMYANMYGNSMPGAVNPYTAPECDAFTLHPTATMMPYMYHTSNDGANTHNAMDLNISITSVASPIELVPEHHYLYIETINQTVDDIRSYSEEDNPAYAIATPKYEPQTPSNQDVSLSTYTSPLAISRNIGIHQDSYQPYSNNQSTIIGNSHAITSVLPNYAANSHRYRSSLSPIASASPTMEPIIFADQPAAAVARVNDNWETLRIAPLSFGWDIVLLMALLALGYVLSKRKALSATIRSKTYENENEN